MPAVSMNVQVRLPPELLEDVDRAVRWASQARGASVSRNAIVTALLRRALRSIDHLAPDQYAELAGDAKGAAT